MGATSDDDETSDLTTETTNQTDEEEESPTKDPPTPGASLESVCDTFNEIISDFTMNDETTAAELNTLASSAGSHHQLEHAIRDIAEAFAHVAELDVISGWIAIARHAAPANTRLPVGAISGLGRRRRPAFFSRG